MDEVYINMVDQLLLDQDIDDETLEKFLQIVSKSKKQEEEIIEQL